MMSTIHARSDGSFIQFTKGAPDVVLSRCSHYLEDGKLLPMTEEKQKSIAAENKGMADQALRVLCAAERVYTAKPEDITPEALEQALCYIGLTGMIDPVREEVKPAIEECRRAGIRPVMITGDHKDTAVAIAKQLGIVTDASQAITGAELDQLSDEELDKCIANYSVYARVQPEHKVRIVQAWKKRGAITAMTGDGVNDAPSIKSADIGIGMGITGTDVTKNVADMILADDNFATIVNAVDEGRRIYDNIRKSIQFLLSSNMSEVMGVFFSTILGFTLLEPVHLLFINLITDCFPALALGMERGESDIMDRPPRDSKDSIFAGGDGLGHPLSGCADHCPDSDLLHHRSLHGNRSLRNAEGRFARRHDHGLPDHEHVRDLPQLQHAFRSRQRVPADIAEQGALGCHDRCPGDGDAGAGGSLHRRSLRLHTGELA